MAARQARPLVTYFLRRIVKFSNGRPLRGVYSQRMTATTIPGSEIKAIRTRLGFSQAEFATLFNTTNITVYRWEADDAKPTGASKIILDALRQRTTEKSEAQLRAMLTGFAVALGLIILLQLLFSEFTLKSDNSSIQVLSKK
jgi:transcriptional regulator with XRE-family HTH domain